VRGRQEGARTVALNGAIRCGYTRYPAPIRSESTDTPFIRCNALQFGCSWSGAASHRAPPSGPLPWSVRRKGRQGILVVKRYLGNPAFVSPSCAAGRAGGASVPHLPCQATAGVVCLTPPKKKGFSDQFLRKINPLWFKILPESPYPEAGEDQLPGQ